MRVPRLIAFHLPQFHPIPENDTWWGKGFTEWTNVVKARPLFRGHYQPHLPADLGFYDLRLPEARQAQADLARAYGIGGFCYYHYWFNGRRLLERPVEEIIASGQPDFPFCLCWANENWTRRWDGLDREVLVSQKYSAEDDIAHIRSLRHALSDPRYIRVNGRPLLLIYRTDVMPDICATTTLWRTEARAMGLGELFLCRVESHQSKEQDPAELGFDAAVEFQPNSRTLPRRRWNHLLRRAAARLKFVPYHAIFRYEDVARGRMKANRPPYQRFPCVTPSWDNSARRSVEATILTDSTPQLYQQWLEFALNEAMAQGNDLVFVNAWNEWAEGNHLEPDRRFGHGYLEATRKALQRTAAMVATETDYDGRIPLP